ncbi:MAG: serine/threonine protein kinase [Labilithrix sp.]|nr:serine/threonine protein kinase [Labilithrix sp.]MCW5812349.1 serine/threonine protein kinase [Labilithrix sp.]
MSEPIRIGRYVVGRELAAGGMASVYLGRMSGPAGFGKTVAIKRMHPQFAKDPEFISMFLDEARITSGLSHPNVVLTLDVLEEPGELLLVMEYVHGGSLASILRAAQGQGLSTPPAIASAIVVATLNGLHAAHETRGDDGQPLHLVHRDVSPQNILVSADGLAKIADFGIAKAVGQVHATSEGVTKGKQAYMAPEQAIGEALTARADVFAAGIVLWEALVGKRLINGANGAERLHALLNLKVPPPSGLVASLPGAIDDVVLRALARDPNDRFATASEMAVALEHAIAPASPRDVGGWVRSAIAKDLASRDEKLADLHRWCRTAAPEMASSVRDVAAIAASTTMPAAGGTAILGPHSAAETVKSDTGISTERDVLPPGLLAGVPSRKVMLVGGAVLGGFALIGLVLIIAVIAARTSTPKANAAPSAPPSIEPPIAVTTPVTAPPPPPPEPVPEPEPAPEPAEPPAPSPAPPPPVAAKPKPPASAKPPTCRIVPQKDAAGRTVFKEICP